MQPQATGASVIPSFVEGEGEADAVPTLVKRLLKREGEPYDVLLDANPFRVGSVDKLVKADFHDWKRFLRASLKRPMSAEFC